MKKILIPSLAILFSANQAFAANTASGTSNVKIVTPISISAVLSLEFGSVAVGTGTPASSGTVAIAAATGVATAGGTNVPRLITAGTATRRAGTFNVTGENNATYSITLPASAVNLTSGANTISIGTFTSSPTPTGTLSAAGAQTLSVGATLTVASAQAAGAYTGTYSVTVNYN